MSINNLPQPIDRIFREDNLFHKVSDISELFDQLVIAMVDLLKCDRCHLYIRDPELLIGQTLHCHRNSIEIPDMLDSKPYSEPVYFAEKDPLFAAALQCERSIFLDDLASVSPKKGDIAFFAQQYKGQKSLVQGHICSNNQLWGIFQASQFTRSRPWTRFDHNMVHTIIDKITPLVSVYVKRKLRHTIQEINDCDN